MMDKILQWFINGRVGLSSKAMATCVMDIEGGRDHPYDPDDLNRCLLFLDAVPEARQHLDKIAKLSTQWGMLIERWDEIEKCFIDEVGFNWCKAKSAPKTYRLMSSILSKASEKSGEYVFVLK